MLIRSELENDVATISLLVTEALKILPQSTGTEARIVEALRTENT